MWMELKNGTFNLGACVSRFALKTLSLGEGVIRYTSKNAE